MRIVASIAARLATGRLPGRPRQTGQICVFGSAPKSVGQPQNILVRVPSSTCVSKPMTGSNREITSSKFSSATLVIRTPGVNRTDPAKPSTRVASHTLDGPRTTLVLFAPLGRVDRRGEKGAPPDGTDLPQDAQARPDPPELHQARPELVVAQVLALVVELAHAGPPRGSPRPSLVDQ